LKLQGEHILISSLKTLKNKNYDRGVLPHSAEP